MDNRPTSVLLKVGLVPLVQLVEGRRWTIRYRPTSVLLLVGLLVVLLVGLLAGDGQFATDPQVYYH